MAKIVLQQVRKTFHDADRELVVLDSVSHQFPESSAIAVMGRSGIGKSTMLHIIGGLEQPSGGSVMYDAHDITHMSDDQRSAFRGKTMGFVFQFHHLLGEFTALENVAMPLMISGVDDQEALGRAEALLIRVGLQSRLTHRPGQLSGGEQQRVAIARALSSNPQVILADEPTGNLDVSNARAIEELLLEMRQEERNTLIVVTHSEDLAKKMDVVLEMQPGGALISRPDA